MSSHASTYSQQFLVWRLVASSWALTVCSNVLKHINVGGGPRTAERRQACVLSVVAGQKPAHVGKHPKERHARSDGLPTLASSRAPTTASARRVASSLQNSPRRASSLCRMAAAHSRLTTCSSGTVVSRWLSVSPPRSLLILDTTTFPENSPPHACENAGPACRHWWPSWASGNVLVDG